MKLNPIFKDGMVLSANRKIKIFGESENPVKITFLGETKTCVPIENKFLIEYPESPCGGPYSMTIESGNEKIVINDVYIGIVLLMCGQSNMMFKVKEGQDELNDCHNDELLRMHVCDHIIFFDGELEHFRSSMGWIKCKKSEIGEWSSIAYQTGAMLRKKYNVAVGLVCAYQGASVIESWLPDYAVKNPAIQVDLSKKHYDHRDAFYRLWNENSRLFDFVTAPIMPYSISAAVWYQGESDTTVEEGQIYDKELELLIESWKKGFEIKNLPCVIVQIADLNCRNDEGWRAVQLAQERAVKNISRSYLVVSKDVSDTFTIHPPKKKLLAKKISETLIKIIGEQIKS